MCDRDRERLCVGGCVCDCACEAGRLGTQVWVCVHAYVLVCVCVSLSMCERVHLCVCVGAGIKASHESHWPSGKVKNSPSATRTHTVFPMLNGNVVELQKENVQESTSSFIQKHFSQGIDSLAGAVPGAGMCEEQVGHDSDLLKFKSEVAARRGERDS